VAALEAVGVPAAVEDSFLEKGSRMVKRRKLLETDEAYLRRLAEGGPLDGVGAVEIMMTQKTALGTLLKTWVCVTREGIVDATIGGRRQLLRLKPPPGDETPYRLIERVAKACRNVDEFGR
jgi:hypothetical protein